MSSNQTTTVLVKYSRSVRCATSSLLLYIVTLWYAYWCWWFLPWFAAMSNAFHTPGNWNSSKFGVSLDSQEVAPSWNMVDLPLRNSGINWNGSGVYSGTHLFFVFQTQNWLKECLQWFPCSFNKGSWTDAADSRCHDVSWEIWLQAKEFPVCGLLEEHLQPTQCFILVCLFLTLIEIG